MHKPDCGQMLHNPPLRQDAEHGRLIRQRPCNCNRAPGLAGEALCHAGGRGVSATPDKCGNWRQTRTTCRGTLP